MPKTNAKSNQNFKNETNTTNSKKKIVIISIIAAFILSILYFISPSDETKTISSNSKEKHDTAYKFKKEGELSFVNSAGNLLEQIDIEIAASDEERTQGLMYRDKMEEKQGMLFIFDDEKPQSFWMKNTLIPLDIIFVNKENIIVKIQKNTDTLSEQSYPSDAPAIYVVEVNAGYCDKYGIKENDRIVWRRI